MCADELFLDFHQAVQVGEGGFGFDHPELGQVAACLGFLGTEGRSVAVDLAKGKNIGLVVELAGLCQICLTLVEVFGLE